MIISGCLEAEIITSSQGNDTDLELSSDGEENRLELNDEICKLFQSDS